MKIRYCETKEGRILGCEVGWGTIDSVGMKSCYDEPMEENCRHIMDLLEAKQGATGAE